MVASALHCMSGALRSKGGLAVPRAPCLTPPLPFTCCYVRDSRPSRFPARPLSFSLAPRRTPSPAHPRSSQFCLRLRSECTSVASSVRTIVTDTYHKFTDYYYYWSVCTGERPYRLQGFQRILRRFELEFTVIKCERLTNSGVLLWLFEEWVLWRYLPSGNCEVPFPSIFKSEYLWSVVSSSTVINLEVLRH